VKRALAVVVAIGAIAGALMYWQTRQKIGTRATAARDGGSALARALVAERHARPFYLSDATVTTGGAAAAGSIAGRVLQSGGGKPVARASLAFLRGNNFDVSADDEGRFRFAPPSPGAYELVSVSAKGFRAWDGAGIRFEARPGVKVEGVTIYLAPVRSFTVVVREPGGSPAAARPAAGATVRAFAGERGAAAATRATCDEKGEAQIEADAFDFVEADKPGFARARGSIDTAAQISGRVVLTLGPGGSGATPAAGMIAGRVVDGTGQPVDGAVVEALSLFEHPGARALSNADGTFSLAELDAGEYTVRASAAGRGIAEAARVATGRSDLELRLAARGGIRGRVVDGGGKPVGSFTIIAAARLGGVARGAPISSTSFGGDGKFEMLLPAGDYDVSAAAHGLARSRERRISVGDEFTDVDFTLARGSRIVGRVVERNGGAAIAGARVTVDGARGDDGVTLSSDALTGADGSFAIAGLAAGRTSLQVLAAAHDGRIVSGIDVPTEGDADAGNIDLRAIGKDEEPKMELVGIGVVIGGDPRGILIKAAVPSGGAALAGLVAGDLIIGVDGTSVDALTFPAAVQMLRGPEDSIVTLTVLHADGSTTIVPVTRKRITT
jgi:hypothetical protein